MSRGNSCTVNICHVTQAMPLQQNSGAKDLFQTKKICKDVFQFFFYRDANQNAPKLHGRKSYLSQKNK